MGACLADSRSSKEASRARVRRGEAREVGGTDHAEPSWATVIALTAILR